MEARRRQGRATTGLSRDQILDTALAIAVADGPDQLTVRGLAAKLGVAVTAIYWHVGDKEALFDGLADRIIDQMGRVTVRGATPEARLVSIGRSLRRSLLAQPDLVAVVHRQGRTAALFQPARRLLVHELTGSGGHGREAALAVQAILKLVVGSVLVDRQVARQPVQTVGTAELWTVEDAGSVDLFDRLTHPESEEALFDWSLRALVRAALAGGHKGAS
jgi:TetR/AcrR family transcriptional regulator, tetracycline repressor protein